MIRAHGWFLRLWSVGALIVLVSLSSRALHAQEQRVLDLSVVPQRFGVGIELEEFPNLDPISIAGKYKLPLSSVIQSITPTPPDGSFMVDLLIRNIGSESYFLPSGLSPRTPGLGNSGRRQISWRVMFRDPTDRTRVKSEIITVTDGAATDRGALTELKPKDSILVRFRVQTPEVVNSWLREGAVVELQAAFEELTLEDGRNRIKGQSQGQSQMLYSDNKVPLQKQ